MQSYNFRLVYDGRGATNHKMPTRLEKKITAGAQEFLGAHAFYYTEGKVPDNVTDGSRYFQIHDLRKREACWEAVFQIDLAELGSKFVREYMGELTRGIAIDAASASKAAFAYFIYCSYTKWKGKRKLSEEIFDRKEPIFSDLYGNHSPMFDQSIDQERIKSRLFERINSSMDKLTAPLDRAATSLDIWIDNQKIDHVTSKFSVSENDITTALVPLRSRLELHRQKR